MEIIFTISRSRLLFVGILVPKMIKICFLLCTINYTYRMGYFTRLNIRIFSEQS